MLVIALVFWGCVLSGCSIASSSSPEMSNAADVAAATGDRQASSAGTFGAATPLPTEVAARIKAALAEQTSLSTDQMTLSQVSPQTWNNACLGAAEPGEFCAEVITPGYQVTISTPKGKYWLHTDQSGSKIRAELAE
ncbi:MAG: hypothetical protein D6742_00480 [Cyanobacteria bacterium J069]|nr:MAG: hypothetical protein D6742_00480 [Cyanobacteria bacterium J069]